MIRSGAARHHLQLAHSAGGGPGGASSESGEQGVDDESDDDVLPALDAKRRLTIPPALPAAHPRTTTRVPQARRRRPHTAREPWCGCRRRMRPPWEVPEEQALHEHRDGTVGDLPGSCEEKRSCS